MLKPLFAARKDVVFFKRRIVLTPIRHIFRGCLLDGSSNPRMIYLKPFFWPLAENLPVFAIGTYVNLLAPQVVPDAGVPLPKARWDVSEPEAGPALIEALGKGALALAERMDDIQACHDFVVAAAPHSNTNFMAFAILHLILGHFDAAERQLAERGGELSRDLRKWRPADFDLIAAGKLEVPREDFYFHTWEFWREIEGLLRLLRNDRRALVAELHAREANAVKIRRLEKYWEPSPFPCEIKGLV